MEEGNCIHRIHKVHYCMTCLPGCSRDPIEYDGTSVYDVCIDIWLKRRLLYIYDFECGRGGSWSIWEEDSPSPLPPQLTDQVT